MSRQDDIRSLIAQHSRRLQKLKEQQALAGHAVDAKILLEIEDIEAELEELHAELAELEAEAHPPPPTIPSGEAPYRGLEYFDIEHAPFFFGRKNLTHKLVERLEGNRFLAVIGPSGSGKSSVVRAGLVHQLQQEAIPGAAAWKYLFVTPTAHPLEALARGLRRIVTDLGPTAILKDLESDPRGLNLLAQEAAPDGPPLLLLVDQFEELFTLCRDQDEQKKYRIKVKVAR